MDPMLSKRERNQIYEVIVANQFNPVEFNLFDEHSEFDILHVSGSVRVIHVRRLFGNKMRLIQLQVSVSTYCYHPGSNGPGSEKPWIDSTFA